MTPLIVKIKQPFGRTLIYPVCKKAEAVAAMVGKKTLSPSDLTTMRFLGHCILIEDMSQEAMERHEKENWKNL